MSHFVVNTEHYAAVTYLRKEPVFALGVLAMLIQGGICSYLYARLVNAAHTLKDAVKFAWLAGGFLVS